MLESLQAERLGVLISKKLHISPLGIEYPNKFDMGKRLDAPPRDSVKINVL